MAAGGGGLLSVVSLARSTTLSTRESRSQEGVVAGTTPSTVHTVPVVLTTVAAGRRCLGFLIRVTKFHSSNNSIFPRADIVRHHQKIYNLHYDIAS